MSSDKSDKNGSPEGDGVHPQGTRIRHFRGYWNFENTKVWVEMFEEKRMSAVAIGAAVGADPSTVSTWLKRHGSQIHQGLHRRDRQPLKISSELAQVLAKGTEEARKVLDERVWGIFVTVDGLGQLSKYCNLLTMPPKVGTVAAAEQIGVGRDSIRTWTLGVDRNYIVRAIDTAIHSAQMPNHKLLPMHLSVAGTCKATGFKRRPRFEIRIA